MSRTRIGTTSLVATLLVLLASATTASAQCCGTSGYTVGYQPVTAYQPVAYQSYRPYTGWYPGYWLGRLFRPNVYTAAYAPTYTAAYAPMYTAAYTPTYSVGYAPAVHSVGYHGSACTTCYSNPCSCTQSVVMRPVTCCDPCATCSCSPCSCGTGSVTQAVYESGGGCASCAAPATYVSPSDTTSAPSTFGDYDDAQPTLAPTDEVPAQRSLRLEAPSTMPADDEEYEGNSVGTPSSYLQAPKLFNPRDNVTDRRASAPIWTAVYQKPADAPAPIYNATHVTIDRAQAERDAISWSAAN